MKTFKEIYDNRNVPFPLEINEEGYGKWYVFYTDSENEDSDDVSLIATRTKKEALYVKQLIQQGHL